MWGRPRGMLCRPSELRPGDLFYAYTDRHVSLQLVVACSIVNNASAFDAGITKETSVLAISSKGTSQWIILSDALYLVDIVHRGSRSW